MVNRIER